MRQILIPFIQNQLRTGKSIPKLAEDIDMEYVTLWRIIQNQSEGNIVSWEKIQKYYKKETGRKI